MLTHVTCSQVRISKAVNPFRNYNYPPEPIRAGGDGCAVQQNEPAAVS